MQVVLANATAGFFETKEQDLPRLLNGFRIPQNIRLMNGSVMTGEEVFLRSLYELVSGENQYNISVNICGRDLSQQSRMFTWFIDHTYDSFQDLVADN